MAHRILLLAVLIVLVALPGCHSGPGLREIVRGLDSPNPDLRRESASNLGRTRLRNDELRTAAVDRLAVMSEMDADPLTRSAALWALAMQDPERAVRTAKLLRTDTSPLVRADAARIIGLHGDVACVKVLIDMLDEERDGDVRREAVKALGNLGGDAAVDELVKRLSDSDLSVAHAARRELMKLTDEDFGMDVSAWRRWYSQRKAGGSAEGTGDD